MQATDAENDLCSVVELAKKEQQVAHRYFICSVTVVLTVQYGLTLGVKILLVSLILKNWNRGNINCDMTSLKARVVPLTSTVEGDQPDCENFENNIYLYEGQ